MHIKANKSGTAGFSKFSGFVSTKQNRIISLTKLVIAISVLFALLMVISR